MDCFLPPFRQLDEVPETFVEFWALANVDVHELNLKQRMKQRAPER